MKISRVYVVVFRLQHEEFEPIISNILQKKKKNTFFQISSNFIYSVIFKFIEY